MDCYPRLRDVREDSDKRQQDIADYLGIHRTMYRRYETGETDIPARHLITLADFYKTSVDYILGRTNETRPYPKKRDIPYLK